MEDCLDLLTQEIESLDIANPVAYGPIIDPQRKGARMICNMPGCYRKSVENFYFSSFYCHAHGSEIPERLRLDCIAENCGYSTYRILYPNENNDTFLCENHHRHHKSTVFQSRFRVQSSDFVLKAGDYDMVLISGLDFDHMYHDVLAQVPGPSRVPWYSKDKTEPLLGVYLLEQIFHAIFVQRQRARECSCGVTHGEVFDFDAVYGIQNELDAAKIRVHDLLEQMDKWADIIREAEKTLEIARNVHRPILDKITRKLHMAGKKVYPDYMWGFTRGY
ncbi:hypothetical protein BGW42_000081 [Actinomortierella wolfii]|nr:hypothetical protein BGW42_000081 [Actinomortierella wolfii]